jgi:hypothetical protein
MRSSAFVYSAAPRHITTQRGDHLRLTQPSSNRWLFIIPYSLIVLVWLSAASIVFCVLGAVLVGATEGQIPAVSNSLFLLGFVTQLLLLFSVGTLRVSYTVLWNLAGREFIEVGRRYIRLVRVARGLARAQG